MGILALPSALVLGLGANGYGIVRSLSRAGVRVTGLYTRGEEFGRLSRHCASRRLPPETSRDDAAFVDVLLSEARRLGDRPVVFATDDRHALLLSEHQQQLAPHLRFHVVSRTTMRALVDKAEMSRRCASLGVLTPRTHITARGEDLGRTAGSFTYPCIVKPSQSFGADFPPGLKNFVAESREALDGFLAAHPTLAGSTIWQEVVPGGDDTIFQCTVLVSEAGATGGVCTIRKIHQYPPGFGITSLGRTEANPDIVRESRRLLESLSYRGIASLEFKRYGGSHYFIELNPRLPWYNALFTDAGVNLPYLAYRDLVGEPLATVVQRNAVYWASLGEELGWLARSRRRERVSLLAWLGGIARARSRAWWNWGDPVPALRALAHLVGQIFGRKRNRLGPAPSAGAGERLTHPAPAGHVSRTDR